MKSDVGTCVLFYLLIMQSEDVEVNPGPAKYPCGICDRNVGWNAEAMQCDSCDIWYHTERANIGPDSFNTLNKTEVTWICTYCGIPNLSSYRCMDLDELKSETIYQTIGSENISVTSSGINRNAGIATPQSFSTPKQGSKTKRVNDINISLNSEVPRTHLGSVDTEPTSSFLGFPLWTVTIPLVL